MSQLTALRDAWVASGRDPEELRTRLLNTPEAARGAVIAKLFTLFKLDTPDPNKKFYPDTAGAAPAEDRQTYTPQTEPFQPGKEFAQDAAKGTVAAAVGIGEGTLLGPLASRVVAAKEGVVNAVTGGSFSEAYNASRKDYADLVDWADQENKWAKRAGFVSGLFLGPLALAGGAAFNALTKGAGIWGRVIGGAITAAPQGFIQGTIGGSKEDISLTRGLKAGAVGAAAGAVVPAAISALGVAGRGVEQAGRTAWDLAATRSVVKTWDRLMQRTQTGLLRYMFRTGKYTPEQTEALANLGLMDKVMQRGGPKTVMEDTKNRLIADATTLFKNTKEMLDTAVKGVRSELVTTLDDEVAAATEALDNALTKGGEQHLESLQTTARGAVRRLVASFALVRESAGKVLNLAKDRFKVAVPKVDMAGTLDDLRSQLADPTLGENGLFSLTNEGKLVPLLENVAEPRMRQALVQISRVLNAGNRWLSGEQAVEFMRQTGVISHAYPGNEPLYRAWQAAREVVTKADTTGALSPAMRQWSQVETAFSSLRKIIDAVTGKDTIKSSDAVRALTARFLKSTKGDLEEAFAGINEVTHGGLKTHITDTFNAIRAAYPKHPETIAALRDRIITALRSNDPTKIQEIAAKYEKYAEYEQLAYLLKARSGVPDDLIATLENDPDTVTDLLKIAKMNGDNKAVGALRMAQAKFREIQEKFPASGTKEIRDVIESTLPQNRQAAAFFVLDKLGADNPRALDRAMKLWNYAEVMEKGLEQGKSIPPGMGAAIVGGVRMATGSTALGRVALLPLFQMTRGVIDPIAVGQELVKKGVFPNMTAASRWLQFTTRTTAFFESVTGSATAAAQSEAKW